MSEYAPEYTNSERVAFLLKQMAWFIPLYALTEFWVFDAMADYADHANCYFYGSISGVHLLMYGLFAGLPLALAAIVFIFEGRRSIAIIKRGQNPLPGEKVFKKTAYKYGNKAKIQPVAILCSVSLLVVFSLWGAVQAYGLTQQVVPCEQQK